MNTYGLNLEKQKTTDQPNMNIEDSIGVVGSSIGKVPKNNIKAKKGIHHKE
jgi:hypothetical protein